VDAQFRPEFVNRLDDIVEFAPLRRDELSLIVDLQVARLIGRVSERGVTVELTDAARELLGNMGYDPTYGARPLKRVISKRLVDPLALGLLKGDFSEGDHVLVDAEDGGLAFTRTRPAGEAAQPEIAVA
jgi:ATP-dependent Clp protease ATP-binding subunit ClpB